MELFFPILGLAFLYLLSWIASLYLLVQFIIQMKAKRKRQAWSVLWLLAWPFFLVGVILDIIAGPGPPSLQQSVGSLCTLFAPFLWLVAFYLFRKESIKDARNKQAMMTEMESQYIIDIRQSDNVWPPPPQK